MKLLTNRKINEATTVSLYRFINEATGLNLLVVSEMQKFNYIKKCLL